MAMNLYVLQYEGKSPISRLIEIITWSKDSHSAIAKASGLTMEAWEKKGVDLAENPWENHTAGTPIRIYQIRVPGCIAEAIWDEAKSHDGEDYDFQSLLGFLPVLRLWWKDDPDSWFCSHFVAYVCKEIGCPLFSEETPLYKLSPGVIPWSPRLEYIGRATNLDEYWEVVSLA